jgi:hypothetical protein
MNKLNMLIHHYFYMGMPQVEFVFDEHTFIDTIAYDHSEISYNPLFRVIHVPYKNKLMFHYEYKNSPLLSLYKVMYSLEHDFYYIKWGHNSKTNKPQYKLSTNKIPLRWFLLLKECMLPEHSCRVRIQKHINYNDDINKVPIQEWIYHIQMIQQHHQLFPAKLYIHSPNWLVHSFRISKFTEHVFYKVRALMVNNNQQYYQVGSHTEHYYSGFAIRNHSINQWRRILEYVEPERMSYEVHGERIYTSNVDIPIEELALIYGILKQCEVKCVIELNHIHKPF